LLASPAPPASDLASAASRSKSSVDEEEGRPPARKRSAACWTLPAVAWRKSGGEEREKER